ncbi:MAG TPA: methyltransferase domain-containing protein [Gemmatimonadales bacterium]|nr:methyltransferase domain-containing protein [Gemmatimonadales bacterium]
MTEWFEQWFGEEYHALYPHRDDEDARRAVALIQSVISWRPGDRILDLACGPGRHAAELERLGGHVVGFDLSRAMLRRARDRMGARLVRGDMRALPFRDGSFALAVNLFTSFGYFLDDAEHRLVVRQVAAALAPGGHFVLDYLNAEQVRRTILLSEQAQRRAGGGTSERRSGPRVVRRIDADGRFVIKEIELRGRARSFQERVRLYSADDLEALLAGAGLRVVARFGDYDAGAPGPNAPRVILVAARA